MKKSQLLIKTAVVISGTFIGGSCFVLYQIGRTVDRLNRIVDTRAACLQKNAQYIYVDCLLENIAEPADMGEKKPCLEKRDWAEPKTSFLGAWWDRKCRGISWRLLELISSSPCHWDRIKSVRKLTSMRHLGDSDYRHLAQMCPPRTAVALAREENVDPRFFLVPTLVHGSTNKQILIEKMHDLLLKLKVQHSHKCLNHFVRKAFPSFKRILLDLDLALEDPRPLKISEETILPLCVESLLHHCLMEDYVKDVVRAGSLQLLMDLYRYFGNNFEIKRMLVNILVKVSSYPEHLEHLYVTGWIGTLVKWSKDPDQRIACTSASALANLDAHCEMGCGYGSEVCLLEPLHRTDDCCVDVILVHGLLGSTHATWKSRQADTNYIPVAGILQAREASYSPDSVKCVPNCLGKIDDDENDILNEWEFVMDDIPVRCSENRENDNFCIPGCELRTQVDCSNISNCWPKDWLPTDCKKIRVIGVNYDSKVTDWFSWCHLKDRKPRQKLADKAGALLRNLIACGVGDRPIVWVAHSMGGLIVKNMLIQSSADVSVSHSRLVRNTKSVFFLGCPHFGSPLAALNKLKLLLMTSKELDELGQNDPQLIKLHKLFIEQVDEYDFKVYSFVETENTKVSSWKLEFQCIPPVPGDRGTGTMYEIPLSHVTISKPCTKLSFIYQKILKATREAARKNRCP